MSGNKPLSHQQELQSIQKIQAINKLVPELNIEENEGSYNWAYRCLESCEFTGGENGFQSPIHALLHFTATILDLDDQENIDD